MADQLPKLVDQFVKDGETIEQLRARLSAQEADKIVAMRRIAQQEATEIELHRQLTLLKRDMKGPDGYGTWNDAAVDQRLQVARLTAENQRLSAENSALRADAERLDWIESNTEAVKWCSLRRSWLRSYPKATRFDDHHPTMRSAIDAARGAK